MSNSSATPWKVWAFDLGDTLVEYEGVPLSWEAMYPEALATLAAHLGVQPSPADLVVAADILRRYNTRVNPRTNEVLFAEILTGLLDCFGVKRACDERTTATVFFSVFRQKLRCCAGALGLLRAAKARGRSIGVYTDVPYGMPSELVDDDLRETGLWSLIDVLVTSRQTGFRKPAVQTLRTLAERLGCAAEDMVYVGNERKDVEVALAFGCTAVLVDRAGAAPMWGQRRTIRSLDELRADL